MANIEALRFQHFPQELLALKSLQTIPAERLATHYRLSVQEVRVQESSLSLWLELSAKVDPNGYVLEWEFAPNHPKECYLNLKGWVSIPFGHLSEAEELGLVRAAALFEEGEKPSLWLQATGEPGGLQFTLKIAPVKFSKEGVTRDLYQFESIAMRGLEFRGTGISQGSNLMEFLEEAPAACASVTWAQIYGSVVLDGAPVAPAAPVGPAPTPVAGRPAALGRRRF